MGLVDRALAEQPLVAERARDLAADKGYDDGEDKRTLYDSYGLRPVIPARDVWKGEYAPLDPKRHDAVYIAPTGEVCCRVRPFADSKAAEYCPMAFCGHEPERGTVKYRCPAAALGIDCANQRACASATKDRGHGRVVRVPLERDRRTVLPTPIGTAGFERAYARRTSIERLFHRLDHLFGLEPPLKSRGLKRARLRVGLGLCAMMATALAWLSEGKPDMARSRLQRAA